MSLPSARRARRQVGYAPTRAPPGLASTGVPARTRCCQSHPNRWLDRPPRRRASAATSPRQARSARGCVIARSQRTRIIYGTAEVMLAKGYEHATVTDIVAAAGVSREVFYEHFTDKHNAFLEARNIPRSTSWTSARAAYFNVPDWPERIWNAFGALLQMIAANPAISHLRLVECYAAGPEAIRRAEEITRSFTIFLRRATAIDRRHKSCRACSHMQSPVQSSRSSNGTSRAGTPTGSCAACLSSPTLRPPRSSVRRRRSERSPAQRKTRGQRR